MNKKPRLKFKFLFIDQYDYIDQLNWKLLHNKINTVKFLVENYQSNTSLVNLLSLERILGLTVSLSSFIKYEESYIMFLLTINNFRFFFILDFFLFFFIQKNYLTFLRNYNNFFLTTFFNLIPLPVVNNFYFFS